jgi:hypothetical protein
MKESSLRDILDCEQPGSVDTPKVAYGLLEL